MARKPKPTKPSSWGAIVEAVPQEYRGADTEQLLVDWEVVRKKKRAALTPRVIQTQLGAALRRGWTVEDLHAALGHTIDEGYRLLVHPVAGAPARSDYRGFTSERPGGSLLHRVKLRRLGRDDDEPRRLSQGGGL